MGKDWCKIQRCPATVMYSSFNLSLELTESEHPLIEVNQVHLRGTR
jgi:hypothetical protein